MVQIDEKRDVTVKKEVHMSQQNLVSFQVGGEDWQAILDAIAVLKEKLLPHLKSLTAEDRHELPKMGDKTVPFVQKTLEYCVSNADLVPPFLDVSALKVDISAVMLIRSLYQPLMQITDALNDTMLLSGSEAYTASLIYYNAVKTAAKSNISGAKTIYEDLSMRFPGRASPAASKTITQ